MTAINLIICFMYVVFGTDYLSSQRSDQAQVIDVGVKGEENKYTFYVKIKSPDRGCDQYADWWEVLD